MTEQEYQTQKADLEKQLADLETEYATTGAVVEYPKWMYHETKGSTVVNSAAEAEALGEGWKDTPAPVEAEPVEASAKKKGGKEADADVKAPDLRHANAPVQSDQAEGRSSRRS